MYDFDFELILLTKWQRRKVARNAQLHASLDALYGVVCSLEGRTGRLDLVCTREKNQSGIGTM